MSINAARTFFRTEERRLMNSTVTVTRDDGEATYDPDTATYNQPETTVYTGDCLIRQNAWQGSDTDVASAEVRLRPWRLKFPYGTSLQRNDRVSITSSASSALDGRTFRITDFYGDDWAPSAPYFAEEVT